MNVLLAESLGMCFGVRDAIQLALDSPHRSDLTILGELVHNTEILRRLREAGVRSVPSVDAPVETSRVMITAHGAARAVVDDLRARGLQVVEATCPLVAHAHRSRPRLGVVSQTTQPIDFVLRVVDQIRAAFPEAEVRFIDTVCQPTKERQTAA